MGGSRKLRNFEIESMLKADKKKFNKFLKKKNKKINLLDESDMLEYLWHKNAPTILKIYYNNKTKRLIFVNPIINSGPNNRPTTLDGLELWYKKFLPPPGNCHSNVEKPFGLRMEKVLRTLLEKHSEKSNPKKFRITWTSPKAMNNITLAAYKDELARAFYQEIELRKVIKSKV